jgi:hypothetical protein
MREWVEHANKAEFWYFTLDRTIIPIIPKDKRPFGTGSEILARPSNSDLCKLAAMICRLG